MQGDQAVEDNLSMGDAPVTSAFECREPSRLVTLVFTLFAIYAGVAAIVMRIVQASLESAPLPISCQIEPLRAAMWGHCVAAVLCVSAALALRSRKPGVRSLKIVVFCAVLGLFLSADRIVNIIWPAPMSQNRFLVVHPERGWTHMPNAEGFLVTPVRLDAHGLRVSEDGPIRQIGGRRRILFLGDSVTFAYGHRAEVSYCHQVGVILNERCPALKIAVLNAGVTGYDPGQERSLLVTEGLAMRPAIVVLQLCLNDVTHQFDCKGAHDGDRHAEFAQIIPDQHWSGFHRLGIRLGEMLSRDRAAEREAGERAQHLKFQELLSPPSSEVEERAWTRVLGQLGDLIDVCEEHDLPLLVVYFPVREQMIDSRASEAPQRRFGELCDKRGTPFLDLLPVLEARKSRGYQAATRFFFDATHPTEAGHRIAAEAVAAELEAIGFIEKLAGAKLVDCGAGSVMFRD